MRPVWLIALLLACWLAPTRAADDQAAKAAELARLRDRIEALRQELESDRGRYDDVRSELRRVERRLGQIARKIRDLTRQIAEKQVSLQHLNAEERDLSRTVAIQRGRLGEQVRAAYAAGRQEYLKILLNQEDPAAVGRMLTYYGYLNRARSERIRALLEALRRLTEVQAQITAETHDLTALKADQTQQQQALESSRADRRTVMERLKREIAGKDQRLSRMLANEKELETLVRALSQALADIPPEAGDFLPFAKLQGKLAWPTQGPVVASYGSPRAGNLTWRGVMIGGKEGAPVHAVSRGRVAFADWLRGYGLLIIIDHDDGFMSLYGHNEALYKETGDWVSAGEVIAAVGDSGGRDQPGLYFEIRHNGKPTDPLLWCRR